MGELKTCPLCKSEAKMESLFSPSIGSVNFKTFISCQCGLFIKKSCTFRSGVPICTEDIPNLENEIINAWNLRLNDN